LSRKKYIKKQRLRLISIRRDGKMFYGNVARTFSANGLKLQKFSKLL
jgi:hypothetical protein